VSPDPGGRDLAGPGLGLEAAVPAEEPLAAWFAPLPQRNGLRALRFEYSSRGDRVPGLLLLPAEGRGPWPLVLLQHGAGGSKESDYLDAARLPWVRRGMAVASIDLPLHGERASAKLTERLLAALAGPGASHGAANLLWREFARQAVADLRRAIDVLAARPEVDPARTAYAAFSLGAILGALYVPLDPRPRAAALALGGGGFGPPALDPARHIGGFAGRALLLVNATRDERIPRSAAEALHAAAGDPKEVLWFDSGHHDLPGHALKAMWAFLARTLEVA
jgi:dienelactone hydrolase